MMKQTYKITGMSCDGCRSRVENALNKIEGVHAHVGLNPPVAEISMDKHIPTEQLQKALHDVGDYTIKMGGSHEKT